MQTVRLPLLRGALFIIALAAISILLARGDNPAQATSYNPQSTVSISDPTPGAHADLAISFSLDKPDAFVMDDPPSMQFIPKQWGINAEAPIGAVGGTFNALATLGVIGITPCIFGIPFTPTMHVASVDTSNPTSALDLAGNPGGPGYSGQFVPDPGAGNLPGGVSRYPDFLNIMFPPAEVGAPLTRMWGGQNVLLAAISMNIVIFRPGQLPGFPASLGYPVAVVIMNPRAPIDLLMLTITSDLCSPLGLVNTSFGVSKDNPKTPADEGGVPLLTNPMGLKAEPSKPYTFTLINVAQPDADNDGVENMLDTCAFDPNIEDLNGRMWGIDDDGLDGACDPDPLHPSPSAPIIGVPDEDLDGYANRADNCPLVPNGRQFLDFQFLQVGEFVFLLGIYGDVIGSSNQADADGDDIGDACEGSEHGTQCANDLDDDADGAVNDGCPSGLYDPRPESGDQCLNATDDDGDGRVNDGCPTVSNAESGAQCANAVDDDGDGVVNEGCPRATGSSESGAQCANAVDDDGDGLVNDGCPTVSNAESGAQCANALDDDGDGKVNDGCPAVGSRAESATPVTIRQFLHPDSVIVSSQRSAWYSKEKAFDGNLNTGWCTGFPDKAPGNFIEAQFASPQDINSLDLANPWAWERFNTGRITMSNGFSQDVTLSNRGEGSFTFSTQTGVTWVRFTGLTQNAVDAWGDACFGEFNLNLSIINVPAECGNDTDDDGDGVVNDGCPFSPRPNNESGAQCLNALDDDADAVVNDGCPPNGAGDESGTQCRNATDDDGDGKVNDGCPSFPTPAWESGAQCANAVDDDFDGKVNDGCPKVIRAAVPETGAQCENNVDDDADGLVNDGCPAVDPGDVEKSTITGHTHTATIESIVTISRHGVKLDNLGGPKGVKAGARDYSVAVSNAADSDPEDIQVALRVVEGCATVNGVAGQNSAVVSVGPGGSGEAGFTVDWTGCADGDYTVQADACHAGDAAPAGFFGAGACPGTSDGKVDANPLDDAPRSLTVVVGTP